MAPSAVSRIWGSPFGGASCGPQPFKIKTANFFENKNGIAKEKIFAEFPAIKDINDSLLKENISLVFIAIEKNKKMLTIPGYIYRLTRFGQAIMPINIFDWFTGSVMGIYKTMEHFTGRKE